MHMPPSCTSACAFPEPPHAHRALANRRHTMTAFRWCRTARSAWERHADLVTSATPPAVPKTLQDGRRGTQGMCGGAVGSQLCRTPLLLMMMVHHIVDVDADVCALRAGLRRCLCAPGGQKRQMPPTHADRQGSGACTRRRNVVGAGAATGAMPPLGHSSAPCRDGTLARFSPCKTAEAYSLEQR